MKKFYEAVLSLCYSYASHSLLDQNYDSETIELYWTNPKKSTEYLKETPQLFNSTFFSTPSSLKNFLFLRFILLYQKSIFCRNPFYHLSND